MKLNHLVTCAIALTAAACGGDTAADPQFLNNAPTLDTYSMSISDGDLSNPAASIALQEAVVNDPACHPHLFARTHEIIARVNRHFGKQLGHIGELIADHPKLKTGSLHVWESVKNGVDRKFTMTKTVNANGSTTFGFELDLAAVSTTGAAPTFVKVFSGTVTRTGSSAAADAGAAASFDVNGSVTYDFDALKSVITTEKSAGQLTDVFDVMHDPVNGVRRQKTVTMTNFLPEDGDPHGPRNGSYVWEREPGKGGSFVYNDTLVLLCPSNPSNLPADVFSVGRWYHNADGTIRGRTDAKATGGQIPAGQTWMGVTCAQGASTSTPAEGYWMMKLENSSGGTVSGNSDTTGATPCDAAFNGTTGVPTVANSANDFPFGSVNATAVYPFPNQW